MSRQDPGAATGQQPYELGECECGELETLHVLNDKGERRACSASGCWCRRYVAVEAGGESCPGCGTRPATTICCSSHGRRMCHACYRRTHFVEICVAGCTDCAREGIDPTKAVNR